MRFKLYICSMTFHIITLFPKIISTYTKESIIGRAIKNKLIKVNVIDLRKFGEGKRRTVDERAYGGGPGMILRIEPILKAILSLTKSPTSPAGGYKLEAKSSKIIITSASGKTFDNKMSLGLSRKFKDIVILCGHYEGIDERLKRILKDQGFSVDEISAGDYVLTGGELPALGMIDAIARKIRGVLGKYESLEENRLGIGVPSYTRPEIFKYRNKTYRVPRILLSGHHAKIKAWRQGFTNC